MGDLLSLEELCLVSFLKDHVLGHKLVASDVDEELLLEEHFEVVGVERGEGLAIDHRVLEMACASLLF